MSRVSYVSCAAHPKTDEPIEVSRRGAWRHALLATVVLGFIAFALVFMGHDGKDTLQTDGRLALGVFAAALWAWAFTSVDDTYVALGAATALVLTGVVSTETFFATLGDDTIWLLVAAFVIAAGVTTSGLAGRATAWLVVAASTPRQLAHLITLALVATALAVPSTSGRAALAIPVFLALASALLPPAGKADEELQQSEIEDRARRKRLVRAMALIFPSVILLSAVASLLGAGAHLVTSRVLETATGSGFDFGTWMLLGLPLAVVSSHLCAELILWLFTSHDDRRQRIRLDINDIERHSKTPVTGALTVLEGRAAIILVAVMALWCTSDLHGVHPAMVALLGALVTTSPSYGSTTLKKTLSSVPWSLLLFMAATLALGEALISSGAAQWAAQEIFSFLRVDSAFVFLLVIIVLSAAAHLLIQSRSARSAVLIPIVVAMAPTLGVNAAAAAFASTAAAGFCHTLPSSAKPVAMFSSIDDADTYSAAHLRRLSIVLGPLLVTLVLLFTYTVWPLLGLSH